MWKSLRCGAGRRKIRKSTARHDGTSRSYSEKSMWDIVTFMPACFSSGGFIVTKVAFNKSGNLDQVDVRVKKANEAKGYRMKLAPGLQVEQYAGI